MIDQASLVESLREEGYRLTPQRMMILGIILDTDQHMTAEEIHQRVCQQYPFVDISTVYRTLQLLKKLRLLSETDLGGGRVEYELTQEARHHHLVCRKCGETFALDDEVIDPLRARLMEKHGFEADMEHFAIFGVCEGCGTKSAQGGPEPVGR